MMRRLTIGLIAAAVSGVGVYHLATAQSEEQQCEATRTGDIVSVDLSTCSTPPTPSSSTASTSPEPSSTTTDTSTTPPPETTASTSPTTSTSDASTTTTAPAPTTNPPSGEFVATFDDPADFYDRFELGVHHRNRVGVEHDDVWLGSHDLACGPPTTKRDVHGATDHEAGTLNETFWWCAPGGPQAGHVMTGMGNMNDGYGVMGFAPARTFTQLEQVCVDVNLNTFANAPVLGRSWLEMYVIPEDIYQANQVQDAGLDHGPLDVDWVIDGSVDDTAHVPSDPRIVSWTPPGGTGLFVGQSKRAQINPEWYNGNEADRFTICVTDNGNDTLTVSEERPGNGWPDGNGAPLTATGQGSFPDEPVRVLFTFHFYDQGKEGTSPESTWHFDDVLIREGR